VTLLGAYGGRLLSGILLICVAPVASAMIGSFYGPGYYLPKGQTGSAYPTHIPKYQTSIHPRPLKWRSFGFAHRPAGYPRGPYHGGYRDYRFRPIPSAPAQAPRTVMYGPVARGPVYRWRPMDTRQAMASRRPVPPSAIPPSVRPPTGYVPAPRYARQYVGQGDFAEWSRRANHDRFRFRPAAQGPRGIVVAHRPNPWGAPPVKGYRFRPLRQKVRDSMASREWNRIDAAARSRPVNRADHYGRQRMQPLTAWRPGTVTYRFRPLESANTPAYPNPVTQRHHPYPAPAPLRAYPGHPFTPFAGSAWFPPHPATVAYHLPGRLERVDTPVMRGRRPLRTDVAYHGWSAFPPGPEQSAASADVVESLYDRPRVEAAAGYLQDASLVSQYALDQRIMIGHENNNF